MPKWAPIPGYETLYEVSDGGQVRSLDRVVINRKNKARMRVLQGRLLLQQKGNGQDIYRAVSLSCRGKVRRFSVHWLMLRAFRGPPEPEQEGCHCDGDWRNNRLSNLRWGTKAENAADRKRHGNGKEGVKHHSAKLNDAKVRQIRRRYAKGSGIAVLAAAFGVTHTTIGRIVRRKGWTHI